MQVDKQIFWARLRHWFGTHRGIWITALSVILVVVVAASVFLLFYKAPVQVRDQQVQAAAEPVPEPPKYYSPLTGNLVPNEAAITAAVTGIMLENSPASRPQSGLKDSGVVFEAVAEGGITRFLAIYQQEKPQLIGPVRSVRMYNVDWIAAFNASVAHIGGSAAALAEVRNGSYRDIDQFFNPSAYYRSTDRFAPHNVYTTFARLDALNAAKGFTSSTFTGFTRKDSKQADVLTATSVNVKISSALYNSSYIYDPILNVYNRFQAGAAHLDREAGQISPRVVIVLKMKESTVFEDGNRQNIATIGGGTGYIFQDGTAQEITWSKPAKTSQITFTDALGVDVPLARGQTWITAVPLGTGGATWQ